MKVLHLSTFDLVGGAARAAYRTHQAMLGINIDSKLIVQHKQSSDPTVIAAEGKLFAKLRSAGDDSVLNFYQHRQHMFSPQWFPDALIKSVDRFTPDLINLNWVCNGFVAVETLTKFKQPLVWTLQDMWAFTGGCHYTGGCDRYTQACGNCPQLQSHREADLSRSVWQRKARMWKNLNLTVVAPSEWMAKCAQTSSLFSDVRVEVIPFGLDTNIFKPIDSSIARELLNLPQAKHLVLFGAIDATGDPRKGFHLLQQALNRLLETGWGDRIELVVFGSAKPDRPLDLGFPVHYLGKLQDDLSLQIAYAAADVMIAPSIEEAFGQTASESLACGTPVVVFANTGLADIVDCHQNGYVAQYCDTADLARGIAWVLEDSERHCRLRQAAREKAEREYAMQVQAHRYQALFHKILDRSKSNPTR
ncbi:glycosyltransferase family 4 protein [Chamaesiphon minutus]|uniref:Glycosyltransferase n=1 Tax=Chamaesiphon minutus (strain ATCC 27169 / PCC 6605) TaxID=1173020 RepID=K9URD7_CHAP6|nr:glycosyltransferase family 4 protein [Chamaesiphon minutus]AFY96799.1 glycosyltransferase [Chamaesiphon minutus PCC 6605]